jgi:hypothetical protein
MTDNDLSGYRLPDNLIPIQLTLGVVREKAAHFINNEFGVTVEPDRLIKQPYKLADFRLIYLELFREISERHSVTDSDYVGWGVAAGRAASLVHQRSDFLDMKDDYQISDHRRLPWTFYSFA